jgi:hypothetical protein
MLSNTNNQLFNIFSYFISLCKCHKHSIYPINRGRERDRQRERERERDVIIKNMHFNYKLIIECTTVSTSIKCICLKYKSFAIYHALYRNADV